MENIVQQSEIHEFDHYVGEVDDFFALRNKMTSKHLSYDVGMARLKHKNLKEAFEPCHMMNVKGDVQQSKKPEADCLPDLYSIWDATNMALNMSTSSKDVVTEADHADNSEGCIIVHHDMDETSFTTLLRTSISQNRQQGKQVLWLKLSRELKNLIGVAIEEGFNPDYYLPYNPFYYHQTYRSLFYIIPANYHTLPSSASRRVSEINVSYDIVKQSDGSFILNDNTGKLIIKLIPANSRFHSQLEVYDGSHRLLFTLRGKIFTLRNTWEATGPSGKRFKVCNSYPLQSDSDLIVKLNKGGEKSGIDYKIRGSKTDKSFFVYKGSSPQVVSKVVSDASDMKKYSVEIDPNEDCDILKEIVFSVAAVVDAVERAGKKGRNAGKCAAFVFLNSLWDVLLQGVIPSPFGN